MHVLNGGATYLGVATMHMPQDACASMHLSNILELYLYIAVKENVGNLKTGFTKINFILVSFFLSAAKVLT